MKRTNHYLMLAAAVTLSFATAQAKPLAQNVEQKIVGGVEASLGEFPFIVSLQGSYGGHFCGGSLIKKNWVLTAAHCVRGSAIKKVIIGMHDQTNLNGTEVFKAKKVIPHPDYNDQTMINDFALIQLDRDSRYQPIALNQEDLSDQVRNSTLIATTAGWGATDEGSYALPPKLQKVEVPLVSQETCNTAYSNQIDKTMICAGYDIGGKDSCQGDSGGPLILEDSNRQRFLIGVVSWGEGCARPNKFGVYSNVSAGFQWIEQNAR